MARRPQKDAKDAHEDFRTVVRGLFRFRVQHAADNLKPLNQSLNGLINTIGWLTETELDKKLKNKKDGFGTSFIRLQPPSGLTTSLVALWADWDFEDENPSCKFEIGFVRTSDEIFGYRFESPHVYEKHRYWHVQFIHKFSVGAGLPTCKASYVSVKTPAFPALVKSPAELGLLATISIYGLPLDNDLRSYVAQIPLTNEHLRPFVPQIP